MNIAYTNYAEEALRDREIGKEKIELTLIKPAKVVDGKKDRKIAQKIFGNKLLRVVYETEAKSYIVISAYYTKPERYARK